MLRRSQPYSGRNGNTPETSNHTSIQERIKPKFNLEEAIEEQRQLDAIINFNLPIKPLLPFEGAITNTPQQGLLFTFADYLELVDYTGRAVLANKRGAIPNQLPPILNRLQIPTETWLANATQFEANYRLKFSKGPPTLRLTA